MLNLTDTSEYKLAIECGFVYDDKGADVRTTGRIDYYDQNGNPDDSALIYRLWDGKPDACTMGIRFTVFIDRVTFQNIGPTGETINILNRLNRFL